MFNGLVLPVRMIVFKLQTGVLLYSPTQYDDALKMEIESLGPVKFIVVPNKMHHLFLEDYIRNFPDAELLLAPGVKDKIEIEYNRGVVVRNGEGPWGDEVSLMLTEGNSFFSEVVLFHKAMSILVVADLVMNFQPGYFSSQQNADGLLVAATQFFSGSFDVPTCSSEHSIYCTDAKSFESCRSKILSWDFKYLVMCHGDIIDDAKQAQQAFKIATDAVLKRVKDRWGFTNSVMSLVGSKK
eukprot:TRINITY_DN10392_c0_g1_i1.p1 TRINITY_DN10392_c0_g1~~TRINITY_DN10392_c0_g1_i1.p1  ORF type:complete len:282 (-),score=47.75 TRINITY_DN10392_c0_g1_i1:75-794(-)